MLNSSTSSYWVGIGEKCCRNETEEEDGDESNRRKFCGYKDRKNMIQMDGLVSDVLVYRK